MNREIDEALIEHAFTVCKEYLGGQWGKIAINEFRLSEIRGGLSNSLYRCSLPENAEKDSRVPKEVLLRIYGVMQDDPNLLVSGAVTFMLLSERKLGPKLYGLLPKGRLEEFIPSHSLSSDEMRTHSHLIAREFAKIHALDVPLRKIPDLFQVLMTQWLHEIEDVLNQDNEEYFLSLSEYKKELEWLTGEIAKSKSPVVFCHNDLQGGNILLRDDIMQNGSPSLLLIDFEIGCYNYREFDFANHFAERCFDYDTPEFPHFKMNMEKFPSRQEQIDFFTNYLDQLSIAGVSVKKPSKEEIESMLSDINLFAGASCLLWSAWSAKLTPVSYEFSHREFGKIRKNMYQKFKEQYLTSSSKLKINKS